MILTETVFAGARPDCLSSLELTKTQSGEAASADLRNLVLRHYKITEVREADHGLQYALEVKESAFSTPPTQVGKLATYVNSLPGFQTRFGFEVSGSKMWFLDEPALNYQIDQLLLNRHPGASYFRVQYTTSEGPIDIVRFVEFLLRDVFPLSLHAADGVNGDLFTHDMLVHLPAFLTMPKSTKAWMQKRLRARLDLYRFALKTRSSELRRFAIIQLQTEVEKIDSYTAIIKLDDINYIDTKLGLGLLDSATIRILDGLGGYAPEIIGSKVRSLGADIKKVAGSLRGELTEKQFATLIRISKRSYDDVSMSQAASMARDWFSRTLLP